MALLTRARGMAVAGATALAVVIPVTIAAPAATAIPAPRAATSTVTPASAPTADDRSTSSSRSSRFAVRARKVMSVGNSLKGVPYRYGGTTPRGFDCSGFTSYVYRKAGVSLPHSSRAQRAKAKRISRGSARVGDLVFFHGSGGRVYHVGIYAGGNKILHSPRSGERVKTQSIWSRNVSFGRVL